MKVLNKTTQLPQKEPSEVMAFLQGVVAKVAPLSKLNEK